MAAVEIEEVERGPWVDELVRIADRDGELDADVVAREGRNPASPLYPYFTHDAGEALDKLNRIEAGRLIRRAEVLIRVEGGETHRYRAFLNTADRKYQPTGTVMSKRAMRDEVLGRMRTDIEVMTARYEKYASIPEVLGVLTALRRWLKEHS